MDCSPRFLQAHIAPQKPECQLGSRTVKLTDEHNESSRSKSTALDSLGEDRPISLRRKKFARHLWNHEAEPQGRKTPRANESFGGKKKIKLNNKVVHAQAKLALKNL